MRFWLLLTLSLACYASLGINNFNWTHREEKYEPGFSFLSADQSFDFKVYEDYKTFYNDFDYCMDQIFEYYYCKGSDVLTHDMKQKMRSLKVPSEELSWILKYYKSAEKMENYFEKEKAYYSLLGVFLYTVDSQAFSNELGKSGTPGIWKCFYDQLIFEHQRVVADVTRTMTGFPSTLYSGLYNSYQYGITDDDGKLKIDVGSYITVSGFCSTSSDYYTALSFLDPGMGPGKVQKNPLLLEITPLAQTQTQAAEISQFSVYQESEYLFPTNVRFKVTKIENRTQITKNDPMYVIYIEETPTSSFFTQVKGKDPNHAEFEKYQCGRTFLKTSVRYNTFWAWLKNFLSI